MDTRKIAIGIIILLLLLPAVSFSETIKKKTKENPEKRTGKIPDGIVKEYYESGKLRSEEKYKDNKLDGLTKFYIDGFLFCETNYKDGKQHGLERTYATPGTVIFLENGKKIDWPIGNITEVRTFKNDHLINSKKYDLDGKLYLDQDYPEEEVFTDEGIKQGLSDTLRTSFFKTGKFTVLERTKMTEILKEQKFQLTGCTTNECAVEIGKILNVNYIVIGSVAKIGKEYVLNIRIVNVESSEVVIADMERSNSEKELIDVIDKLVVSICNRMVFKDDNTKLILSGAEVSIAVLDVDVK